MPDLETVATTCPLCLGPDEVSSMVTVEIDRVVPRGRVAIMICRSCVGAVILAARRTEPELSDMTAWIEHMIAKSNTLGESMKPNGEKDDDSSTD